MNLSLPAYLIKSRAAFIMQSQARTGPKQYPPEAPKMQRKPCLKKMGMAVGVAVLALLAGPLLVGAEDENPSDRCAGRGPRVTVDSGTVEGLRIPASNLGIPEYFAFLGIPYVKPPLGKLRFKSPRPVEPWEGVRNAVLYGMPCMQVPKTSQSGPYSEDCLYLNVYTPRINRPRQLLPVLVHVHGGAMTEGTGNVIRPDYFVGRDLVVVTFNYRLGYFGFLNLDNDVAPGNAGFKDMVAAFKWVRRNIHHFGGDPDQVTINGCSSAGVSVHWMTLLPETEGLFKRAIIKSGSALLSWAYTEHHRDLSDRAVAFLRKWWPNSTDVESLHERTSKDLQSAFMYADRKRPKNTPETVNKDLTVSLERRRFVSEPKMILKDGEAYILEPARTRVPIIIGITNCEYESFGEMAYMTDKMPEVDSPGLTAVIQRGVLPTTFAQQALGIDATYSHNWDEVTLDVRATLFNLSAVNTSCDLKCRWGKGYSAAFFTADTARAIRMHAREDKVPVYAYYYDYPLDGKCAKHAEDDRKVWPQDVLELMALNTTNPLSLNILRQVTLFANFAKYGKPVPETDPVLLTTDWLPMEKDQPDVFMKIGKNLTLAKGDILDEFGPFWKGLYEKYRDGRGI